MRALYKTASAVMAAAVIGFAGMTALDAQQQSKPLPAYIVAEQDVFDTAAAQKFAACNAPTMASFHPNVIVRGGKTDVINGTPPKRVIVIGFESAAAARAWVDSPAHQACQSLQDAAMHERAYIVEGIAP